MKHTALLFSLFFIWTANSPLYLQATVIPEQLLDTWTLRLKPQTWPNGRYRYRVLSFWQTKQGMAYLDLTIYPKSGIRSNLIMGRASLKTENTLIIQAQKQIQVLHEGKGIPTPFSIKNTTLQWEQSQPLKLEKHNLQFGNEKNAAHFTRYSHSWAVSQKEQDISTAMDLFMLNIYLIQSQLEYFGSIKMLRYKKVTKPGFISGQMYLNIVKKGLLGLGNSGLMFNLQDFQQLAGSRLNGQFLGGAYKMDGSLELSLENQPIKFTVDFSKVKIKNGYANSGVYQIHWQPTGKNGQYHEYEIPVEWYGN